jgi:hypothetical protein
MKIKEKRQGLMLSEILRNDKRPHHFKRNTATGTGTKWGTAVMLVLV